MKIIKICVCVILFGCILYFNPFTRCALSPEKPKELKDTIQVKEPIKEEIQPVQETESVDELCFNNEYFIIKEKGYKYFLIQRIKDQKDLAELNKDTWDEFTPLYHSKKEGDTIYFKFIKKDRFFRLK